MSDWTEKIERTGLYERRGYGCIMRMEVYDVEAANKCYTHIRGECQFRYIGEPAPGELVWVDHADSPGCWISRAVDTTTGEPYPQSTYHVVYLDAPRSSRGTQWARVGPEDALSNLHGICSKCGAMASKMITQDGCACCRLDQYNDRIRDLESQLAKVREVVG